MGCGTSTAKNAVISRKRPGNIGEVTIFVPGLRIPKNTDFSQSLGDTLPKSLLERLSALRARIVVMAAQEATNMIKRKRRTAKKHGGSSSSNLLQALEEYLPVLLGLVKDGSQLVNKVQFMWVNQEDSSEDTSLTSAWYEVLSVLHLMAMLCLSEANSLLLPTTPNNGYYPKVSEEIRTTSIDILLKAAGYLDCAIQHVLPQIPSSLRKDLPVDLAEDVLRSLCMQALGQSVDIQLGMAVDNPKATLAVKRRLACEMAKCWHQAEDHIMQVQMPQGWGAKHLHFVKWKHAEAKAAAYYYHGLILDEGNTEKSHEMAVAALQAANEFLKDSKRVCEAFNAAYPTSRNPPPWGFMRYLSEKLPKDVARKVDINIDLYGGDRTSKSAPTLPDFAIALKPDEYQLPPLDPSWK